MRYPVTYTRLFARELRLAPHQLSQLLAGTSISADELLQLKPSMSLTEQLRVVRNAMALAERPTFALEVASRLSLAAHGSLGTLLSASKDLNQAWNALVRYYMLRLPLVEMSVHYHESSFELYLRPTKACDEVMIFIMESLMLTIQRGIELVLGRKLIEGRFEFGYAAPDYAEQYGQFFNSPCVFGTSGCRVLLPLALMSRQNPFHDEPMHQQAMAQCEQLLAQLRLSDSATSWQQRVTQVLRDHSGRLWTGSEIADYFQLSARTLIRHLKAENTSYQAILDQELARQAVEYLQMPRHTVESTAFALGYGDATAFRRAFHRWFGMSPSSYLKHIALDCQH